LGVAANKFDLFEKQQQVTENEGKEWAAQIGAAFSSTSAKSKVGIEPLFKEIGERIYDLNNQSVTFDETVLQKTKIGTDDEKRKKKGCCKGK
jgi:50S ribosomal subunit-associated GTPase HflX